MNSKREQAVAATREACYLCRQVQANLVSSDTLDKRDKSPVTIADFGAQAVVAYHLQRSFPDTPMVGEEDAGALREPEQADLLARIVEQVIQSVPNLSVDDILQAIDFGTFSGGTKGSFWVLDPIDGTKGFLRGQQYAVALGLIEEGQLTLGVLGCPNLPVHADRPDGPKGVLFVAEAGQGATQQGLDDGVEKPISVTNISDPAFANFCESVESGHSSHDHAGRIAAALGVTAPPFRIDSQCKYGAVARGNASIYLRLPTRKGYEEKIWDHAAGALVVQEAGGTVTDVNGASLDFSLGRTLKNNVGVVATNGLLHDQVIEAVQNVLTSS